MSSVEELISDFKKSKWSSKPFERMVEIVLGHPERVRHFAETIASELPEGGTFLDASLSFLPESEWAPLVDHALDLCNANPGNEAAESIVAYASLQSSKSLHRHLDSLLANPPNKSSYYASWPWRESADLHAATLEQAVLNADSPDDKLYAWCRALETRNEPILLRFLELAEKIDMDANLRKLGVHGSVTLKNYLRVVGYEYINNQLRRLVPDAAFHIVFPPGYVEEDRPWLKPIRHPTWKASLGDKVCEVKFGGGGDGMCGHCGGTLHNLLTFEAVPSGLGVAGMPRLLLQSCLSCLGWTAAPLFYQHDATGTPQPIGAPHELIEPEFPAEPLAPCRATIVETPQRWVWQDWGLSNSRENLNRIGGEPCWVQDAEYPSCPHCANTMRFLFQLDSDLPTADGGEWLWGSGGICYAHWCDSCRVSAFLWQCT